MAERERKQKPAPKEREEAVVEEAAPAKQGEKIKEELDDLVSKLRALTGIHSVDRFDTETL